MSGTPAPVGGTGLLGWVSRHHVGLFWAFGGLVLGLAVGAWVGSAATCATTAEGCRLSWVAVEAVGTWVGALGGTAAVLAAVLTYWSGEAKREDDRALAREAQSRAEEDLKNRASRVTVRWYVSTRSHDGLLVTAKVRNRNTEHTVHDVRVDCPAVGRRLSTRAIAPGLEEPTGGAAAVQPTDQDEPEWMASMRATTTLTYLISDVEWTRVGDNPPHRTGQ